MIFRPARQMAVNRRRIRLKLLFGVSGAAQLLVQGQEALVEHGEFGEEVPGGVEGPQPQLPVAGDVESLGGGLAVAGAAPPERDQERRRRPTGRQPEPEDERAVAGDRLVGLAAGGRLQENAGVCASCAVRWLISSASSRSAQSGHGPGRISRPSS